MEYPPAARPPVVKRGRAKAYANRGLGVYVKLRARSAGVPSFYLSWNFDLIDGDEEAVPTEKTEDRQSPGAENRKAGKEAAPFPLQGTVGNAVPGGQYAPLRFQCKTGGASPSPTAAITGPGISP